MYDVMQRYKAGSLTGVCTIFILWFRSLVRISGMSIRRSPRACPSAVSSAMKAPVRPVPALCIHTRGRRELVIVLVDAPILVTGHYSADMLRYCIVNVLCIGQYLQWTIMGPLLGLWSWVSLRWSSSREEAQSGTL